MHFAEKYNFIKISDLIVFHGNEAFVRFCGIFFPPMQGIYTIGKKAGKGNDSSLIMKYVFSNVVFVCFSFFNKRMKRAV